jgi:thiamine biosynthesis lipoprotein
MGTLVRITVYAPDEEHARAAFRAGFDRIRDLDALLSDYKPDSELNRIAKTAVARPTRVSDDLFTVLRASQELAIATDGAFDITQGPVIQLWRKARASGQPPDPQALRHAEQRAGFRKLHVDVNTRTVMVDSPGMALDVGAIGKGYAASEALAALGRTGVRSALVAVSGDLAFSEAPPGERGWRIGVHTADPAVIGIPAVLELTDAAISTAGSSEQHLDVDGRRYSHIIDPATGMGLVNDITVTVVAKHGLEADGLDTAISVLGADRGLALVASRHDAAALIIQRNGNDVQARASERFRKLVEEHASRR